MTIVAVLLGRFFNFGGLSTEEEVAEEGLAVINVLCCVVFLALGEVVRVEGGVGGEREIVDVTVEEERLLFGGLTVDVFHLITL